ncbi:RNA polymerase subunit sigma-24 [Sphingomonas fennica]|uniref:RNA polymerase sigma factor n=2 Tax=Edaphosphingomonas fennica TaxID=114404 RepID=A0A2T4HRI2_9SPHN|nr:RNA polymerase subunit sigma-24 [Sphingomonas fennica]
MEPKRMNQLAERYEDLQDTMLAARIAAHDQKAVRIVVERCNQRLFRTAWSILKDRTEAEDIVQSTYLHAFTAIGGFEGRSSLATWLTRIAINEALQRRRSLDRRTARLAAAGVADLQQHRNQIMQEPAYSSTPDVELGRAQIKAVLETAIAELPEDFRMVFLLCEVEGLSTVARRLRSPVGVNFDGR